METSDMLAELTGTFGQLLESAFARAQDPAALQAALEELQKFQTDNQDQLAELAAEAAAAGGLSADVQEQLSALAARMAELETISRARLAWSEDLDRFIRAGLKAAEEGEIYGNGA